MLRVWRSLIASGLCLALLWNNASAFPPLTRFVGPAGDLSSCETRTSEEIVPFSDQALTLALLFEHRVLPVAIGERRSLRPFLVLLAAGALMGSAVMAQTRPVFGPAQEARSRNAEALSKGHDLLQALVETRKQYLSDLQAAIDAYDHGVRSGRLILPGADDELSQGQEPGDKNIARQKLFVSRLLAGSEPSVVLTDLAALEKVLRAVDVVLSDLERLRAPALTLSSHDSNALSLTEWQAAVKKWKAMRAAITKEFNATLIDLPLTQSPVKTAPQAVVTLGATNRSPDADWPDEDEKLVQPNSFDPASLPAPLVAGERRILIIHPNYALTVTFQGRESDGYDHFFQDEWQIRETGMQTSVQWTLAQIDVDPRSGQHTLAKAYPPVYFPAGEGGISDYIFTTPSLYHVRYVDPPNAEPSRADVEAAREEMERSRARLRQALQNARKTLDRLLALNDRNSRSTPHQRLDQNLPLKLRESLFAIRGDVSRVEAVRNLTDPIQDALALGDEAVSRLEHLTAWANRPTTAPVSRLSPKEWNRLQGQAVAAINAYQALDDDLLTAEPPRDDGRWTTISGPLDPYIVRLRVPQPFDNEILQDVWISHTFPEKGGAGPRTIQRTTTRVQVEPKTGAQTVLQERVASYIAEDGNSLQDIFDDHSGDDLLTVRTIPNAFMGLVKGLSRHLLPLIMLGFLPFTGSAQGLAPFQEPAATVLSVNDSRYESLRSFTTADIERLSQDIRTLVESSSPPGAKVEIRFDSIPPEAQYEWMDKDGVVPCRVKRTDGGFLLVMNKDYWLNPGIPGRFTGHALAWDVFHESIHMKQMAASGDPSQRTAERLVHEGIAMKPKTVQLLRELRIAYDELDANRRGYEEFVAGYHAQPSDAVIGDFRRYGGSYREHFEKLIAQLPPVAWAFYRAELEKAGGVRYLVVTSQGLTLESAFFKPESPLARIVGDPDSMPVPSFEMLEKLFWPVPELLTEDDSKDQLRHLAWLRTAERAPDGVLINFLIYIFKSDNLFKNYRRANELLTLVLHSPRFRAALKNNPEAMRILTDRAEISKTQRTGDPGPITSLLEFLAKPEKATATPAGSLEEKIFQITLLNPERDLEDWEAMKNSIEEEMTRPESFGTLVRLFKKVMADASPGLKNPDFRTIPELLHWIGQGPVESLSNDREFIEEIQAYLLPRLGVATVTINEDLLLLIPLHLTSIVPLLKEALPKVQGATFWDPTLKPSRIQLILHVIGVLQVASSDVHGLSPADPKRAA